MALFKSIIFYVWALILHSTFLHADNTSVVSAEKIIEQELLLNNLITHLHFLQLDFQNHAPREQLYEILPQLNEQLRSLPPTAEDLESLQLLKSIHARWPVIHKHIQWIINLKPKNKAPVFDALTQSLEKLDRQLLVLRQIKIAKDPKIGHPLRYAEQALLMQKVAREYLNLNRLPKLPSIKQQTQLQAMATQFEKRMNSLQLEFQKHPHAKASARKASFAWQFIAKSIHRFPERPVPSMVAFYCDEIVEQLSSLNHFFSAP